MRAKRQRPAEQLESERRTRRRRARPSDGVPKLGLWECGVGSLFK
ncbi:hypothetical protein [Mycolicibacterium vaccae]|jgi:hypothetical protein|nr:hypothetical protein [Mycolicibacterium vaccae]